MAAAPDTDLRPASPMAIALALAAVYILWGSTYLAIRFALHGYPPFILAAIRMAIAGAIMYAVLRARGLPAIAVASMPLFAGVFAMLRGRHPSRMEWMGLIVGFVGVIWLSVGGELAGSTLGLACLIIAPLAWAWGSIWSRDQDLPEPFMMAAGQMLVGTIWLVLIALVTGERITTMPSFESTAALLYLVVAGSIFGFTAYIWLLHHVRPALATSYAYVNPPLAVLFGTLLAGERFTTHDLGAMAVILAGVVIITIARARAPKPVAEPVA